MVNTDGVMTTFLLKTATVFVSIIAQANAAPPGSNVDF